MDYLRTLGSAAVSSFVQKSGLTLPFSLGSKVTSLEGKTIWTLYEATKREDGSPVSIFEFDSSLPRNRNTMPLAKNALRKLRTIRHPDVLKFLDVVETESTICIMTERVRPLAPAIQERASKAAQEKEDWLLWGLHRISVALAFINDTCASTHGNVRIDSIFISPSGEWKLGDFELLSNPKDDAAVLYTMGSILPDSSTYSSPEVKKNGWSVLKENPIPAADSYSLGLLIHFAFNPSQPLPPTAQPPHPQPNAASRGSIPTSVFPAFRKLLNPNPKARLTPKTFLELGMAETAGDGSGFFASNRLVKVCAGLDNFNLGSESDKAILLRTLKESASSLPPEFSSYKVLPALASALEFGGASATAILPLILQFSKNVSPQDYPNVVLVHIVKLYTSPDRGTRMALLDTLPEYADKLDKKTVVDKIWPNLQTGFADTVPVIREATVKSIILLSDKFNERILNNDLLRHLAHMQADPEASIRTNACILIGRLGPTLGYNTKRKVLVPAFTKALRDPFVHCRVAGLMALMATVDCFEHEELASKVIPNMSFALVDKEKLVRDQAFKAIQLFIKKLEDYVATLPETLEEPQIPGLGAVAATQGQGTLVSSAAGAAGALAGWAITSLGKKLAASEAQSTMSATPNGTDIDRPISAPPPSSNISPNGLPSMASTLTTPLPSSRGALLSSSSKVKAMHLRASKQSASSSNFAAEWAQQAAAEAEAIHTSTWGDDLMDVNADEDDWSAFETAPSKPPVVVGLGFANVGPGASDVQTGEDWGDAFADNKDEEVPGGWGSTSSPALVQQPKPSTLPSRPNVLSTSRPTSAQSSVPSRAVSPAPLTPTTSTLGMTKEEKAAEMARRKEERRLRIAALKEQKKQASAKT